MIQDRNITLHALNMYMQSLVLQPLYPLSEYGNWHVFCESG